MKKEIENLISLTFDDSKKVSGEATRELCKICNNIIKKYYDIAKKYNRTYHDDHWEYYDPYCDEHRIHSLAYYEPDKNNADEYILEFLFSDVDDYDNSFYFPTIWLDDNYFNTYENLCKDLYIDSLHDELKRYEMNIKKYTELKNKTLEKLKNI